MLDVLGKLIASDEAKRAAEIAAEQAEQERERERVAAAGVAFDALARQIAEARYDETAVDCSEETILKVSSDVGKMPSDLANLVTQITEGLPRERAEARMLELAIAARQTLAEYESAIAPWQEKVDFARQCIAASKKGFDSDMLAFLRSVDGIPEPARPVVSRPAPRPVPQERPQPLPAGWEKVTR